MSYEIKCPVCEKHYSLTLPLCPYCSVKKKEIDTGQENLEPSPERARHCFLVGVGLILGSVLPVIIPNLFGSGYVYIFTLFEIGNQPELSHEWIISSWLNLIQGIFFYYYSKDIGDNKKWKSRFMAILLIINTCFLIYSIFPIFSSIKSEELSSLIFILVLVGSLGCLIIGGRTLFINPKFQGAKSIGRIGSMLILILSPLLLFIIANIAKAGSHWIICMLSLLCLLGSCINFIRINKSKNSDEIRSIAGLTFKIISVTVPIALSLVFFSVITPLAGFLPPLSYLSLIKIIAGGMAGFFLFPIVISEILLITDRYTGNSEESSY